MYFSTCDNDDAFGPAVEACRDGFDFTVKFELLIFSIIPSALFIVLSTWRIATSLRKPVIVYAPLMQLAKAGTIALYFAFHVALVVLVAARSSKGADEAIISAVLTLVAAGCMAALSFIDHGRSARPSLLLNIYLFLTLLPDVAQTRTYWLAAGTKSELTLVGIFTASMSLKVLILLLEAQQKTRWVRWVSDTKKLHSPEETSSIYNLGVYFWMNGLFFNGYRKILQMADLYPLDHAMAGAKVYERFEKYADYSKLRGDRFGLAKTLARTLWLQIMLAVPPRLTYTAFMFCQPFLVNTILDQLSKPTSHAATNASYGLIGATIIIYSGIGLSMAFFKYLYYRMLQMARGVLVTAIFAKATQAELGSGDSSASITLMSVDIERINLGFINLHEVWASTLEVALASWLLYRQLGSAFAAPIVIVIISCMGLMILIRYTGASQRAWMAGVQRRVGLTATVIAGMKNIKMAGLAEPVTDFVQKLRVDELKAGSRFRRLSLMALGLAFGPMLISPFVTFAIAQRSLDATTVYTSLSYLLLLTVPLVTVIKTIPALISGFACLGRIQAFLECKDREDFRTILSSPSLGENSEKESIEEVKIPAESAGSSPAIVVRDGTFGWDEAKAVLHDINLQVPNSGLTIIVGPIASGKSTLCNALLGEIPFRQGHITLSTKIGRVAYCDQSPFLFNASIQDNICGYSKFDLNRYTEVIEATMLKMDLEILPRGDRTIIGSNGIALSGGQRQRISLARALYLQSDILVLDDVFSGLDADTEDQVFSRVFGPNGILHRRQATTVLCTHSVRHLPSAQHIIALSSEGAIVEQGTFDALMENKKYVHSLGVKVPGSIITSAATDFSCDFKDIKPKLLQNIPTVSSVASELPERARQTGDQSMYKHYFKSMGLFLAGSMFWWGIVYGFFYNFPTIWLKYWTDDAFNEHPMHSYGYYLGIYSLLQICALISLLGLGLTVWVLSILKSGAYLHRSILITLMRAPLRFLTMTDQGVITNLFSQDLNLVDTDLPNAMFNVLYNVCVALGQAIVMVTSSPYLAICYPFLAALVWVIQKFYLRTSRQLRMLDLEAKSPLYTHFLDTTRGIVTLRAFGFISEDRVKNLDLLDTSQRPAYLLLMVQQWLVLVLNLVVMVIAAVLVSLALLMRSNTGFAGASLVTLMGFGESLSDIVVQWTKLETSVQAVGRLQTFKEKVLPENRKEEDIIPSDHWPLKGKIELRGVSASYDVSHEGGQPKLALSRLDLSIEAGEKVAICGRTGSGKSSMIALLLKLLDPLEETSEQVFIDDTPLHRLDRVALRRRLITIPQEAVFLPDGSTVRQNLDPFALATADECRDVLKTVKLWPLIAERGGLNAGMKPSTFSQGQRQLFSLAYAVLRRRLRSRSSENGEGGILLLDEVSSSVDQETERVMQEIIRIEFNDYTVVAITHRLDMIMDFNRVVVMDKGEVVEVGAPTELSGGENSRFGDLWRASQK